MTGKCTVGSRCYVARCVIVEGLGRDNCAITNTLDSSRSDSAEIIISITHFGRICKYYVMKTAALESATEMFYSTYFIKK